MKRVKKKKGEHVPGSHGFHEALDRSFITFEFFSKNITEHPAVRADKKLMAKAEKIERMMWDLYQTLGKMHLDD